MKWALIILLIFPYQEGGKKQRRTKPDYASIEKNMDLLVSKIDSFCVDSIRFYQKDTIMIDTGCLYL